MAMDSVAVAHTHHPQILNVCKVAMHHKRVLISFLLPGDESLTRFDGVHLDWAHVFFPDCRLVLIFQ